MTEFNEPWKLVANLRTYWTDYSIVSADGETICKQTVSARSPLRKTTKAKLGKICDSVNACSGVADLREGMVRELLARNAVLYQALLKPHVLWMDYSPHVYYCHVCGCEQPTSGAVSKHNDGCPLASDNPGKALLNELAALQAENERLTKIVNHAIELAIRYDQRALADELNAAREAIGGGTKPKPHPNDAAIITRFIGGPQ